jgi:hypothetical protein
MPEHRCHNRPLEHLSLSPPAMYGRGGEWLEDARSSRSYFSANGFGDGSGPGAGYKSCSGHGDSTAVGIDLGDCSGYGAESEEWEKHGH